MNELILFLLNFFPPPPFISSILLLLLLLLFLHPLAVRATEGVGRGARAGAGADDRGTARTAVRVGGMIDDERTQRVTVCYLLLSLTNYSHTRPFSSSYFSSSYCRLLFVGPKADVVGGQAKRARK